MIRTQISLDSEAHRRARRRAADLGISLAEYVRRLVDEDLRRAHDVPVDLAAVCDLGDGGPTDIATSKDRLLGAAVASRKAPGG